MSELNDMTTYGFHKSYSTVLYFDKDPEIIANEIKYVLEDKIGKVSLLTNEPNLMQYKLEDFILSDSEDEMVIISLSLKEENLNIIEFTEYMDQTWNWEEAGNLLKETKYQLTISDNCGEGMGYKQRLVLCQLVTHIITSSLKPIGILWQASSQLIEPNKYLDNIPGTEEYDPLYGAINVRLFTIEGKEENTVMDTVGLAALGLVDVQCYFYGYDVDQVANHLYAYGQYIFWNGDVIKDGDTIEGIEKYKKWGARHELSLLEPRRPVLNIGPDIKV